MGIQLVDRTRGVTGAFIKISQLSFLKIVTESIDGMKSYETLEHFEAQAMKTTITFLQLPIARTIKG